MEPRIDRVLIDRIALARRVEELAGQIAVDFESIVDRVHVTDPKAESLTLVPIMTGSIIFVADLIRRLPLMLRMRMVTVSSYPGRHTTSQGAQVINDLPTDFSRAHVLIVDDVLDSGQTLGTIRRRIASMNPASVRTCVLLRKDRPAAREVPAEYVGFDIDDVFVVGYGLDYDGLYRNLPDLMTLTRSPVSD
jgi:hypoxanthine phosphoribosyltransferase